MLKITSSCFEFYIKIKFSTSVVNIVMDIKQGSTFLYIFESIIFKLFASISKYPIHKLLSKSPDKVQPDFFQVQKLNRLIFKINMINENMPSITLTFLKCAVI